MGRLAHPRTDRLVALGASTLVGRGPAAFLRLEAPTASGEHATLRWRDGGWWIRDLGSSNGTWVDDHRLGPGEEAPVPRGASLGFGGQGDPWRLDDDGPPGPFARCLDRPRVVSARQGTLLLPDDISPALALVHDAADRWVRDDAEAEPVRDGQLLEVAGERWQLHVPQQLVPTMRTTARPARVRFLVSRDEEQVEIEVVDGDRVTRLPPRSFHYTLLTLARERLRDAHLDEAQQGWLDRLELAERLRIGASTVNVQLFRARKAFGGVRDELSAQVVERRVRTSQVRFGFLPAAIDGA